ncbi:MAG: MFS transporter, partial [Anaerolineae bacterium]|nr:MFS transporter [Anaerolineae bacterium]
YAAFIGLGLITSALGPTLPGLAEQTQTTLGQISFLFVARSLGYLFGSFIGGRLYDRIAGHPLIAGLLLMMAVSAYLVPFMSLLWMLVAVLVMIGIAEATVDVGCNTLVVWVHKDKVGPFMNGLHFFFGVGAFLSPVIIGQALLLSEGIAWGYWTMALLILPVALSFLLLPSPPIQKTAYDGSARVNKPFLVVLIALFFFFYVGLEVGYGGWIYTYATTLELTSEANAAYLTSAYWGALTVGRLLSIPVANRLRPRTIIAGDLAGALLSVIVLLLWPQSLAVVWIGTLGLGLSIASIFPTMLSLAERNMTVTGQTTSWFFVGASTGGMSMPWLIGQLFEITGPYTVFWASLVGVILTAGLFSSLLAWVHRSSRQSTVALN